MKIVITGGHHTSALPIVKRLREKDSTIEFLWFGHKFSAKNDRNETLEFKEITALGIPFFELHAGKLYKTYDLIRLLKIPFGFLQALYLLIKTKPGAILSFGGYLAVPVVFAGWFLGIPAVTHEQTVVAGYANRFIGRFAKRILITWPQSRQYFPPQKVILTGMPMRKEIFTSTGKIFQTNPSLPTIYITAGKTGSHKINLAIAGSLENFLRSYNVIHQCGDNSVYNDFDKLARKYENIRQPLPGIYYPRKFVMLDEIGEAFAKANLVVARAGAHIVYELLTLKKPALLIPIPWVSHNEQEKNALALVEAGLGKILPETNLTGQSLFDNVTEMLKYIDKFELKAGGTSFSPVENSADLIADEIIKVSKTN